MRTLTIDYNTQSNFGILNHPYNKRFVSFLSQGIKPLSCRKFDAETKKWSVHSSKIPLVIAAGKRFFDYVDYKSLPEDLQIKVVQFISDTETEAKTPYPFNIQKRPHAVLYVMPDAPIEVIRAAYKALATKHHPDHGGDPEVFMEIQAAYERLIGN